jgi:hypothetical protein
VTGRYSNQLNYHSFFASFATIQTRSTQPIYSVADKQPIGRQNRKAARGKVCSTPCQPCSTTVCSIGDAVYNEKSDGAKFSRRTVAKTALAQIAPARFMRAAKLITAAAG